MTKHHWENIYATRSVDEMSLAAELGSRFTLLDVRYEVHSTPRQSEQRFIYCLFGVSRGVYFGAPRSTRSFFWNIALLAHQLELAFE